MNRNDYFGNRRSVSNRLEDYGYSDMALATGATTELPSTQAELIALMETLNKNISDLQAQHTALVASRNSWYIDYQKKVAENCESLVLRSRRESCISDRNFKKSKVDTLDVAISAKATQIKLVKERLEEVKKTLENLREVSSTLAESGKTEAQIKIEAQANADVIVQKAKVQSETIERKSKSKKIIILSIVLTAVLLTGIYVLYRIRKNRK